MNPQQKNSADETNSCPPQSMSRREFIVNMIMTIGALLGIASLLTRFMQFLYPIILPVKMVEVFAIKRTEIPLNSARPVNLPQGKVMIANKENQIQAFSAICTHLACLYQWEDDKKRFHCPCHHGIFALDGKVISGPPPRPLDRIETIVRGDDVFLRMPVREEAL